MLGNSRDPLQEALNAKRSRSSHSFAVGYNSMFKEQKYDLEFFWMSFSQRIVAFAVSVLLGALLFFYSMTRLLTSLVNPAGFVLPYAFSNIIFCFMFGFLSGFKT
ncbi:hypothetical protein PAPHI01_1997, partial [Pancytospora philotis]